jgi:hypothetical protein
MPMRERTSVGWRDQRVDPSETPAVGGGPAAGGGGGG